MVYIIKTNNVTKCFQGKEVVSNINMNVKKGEIYGFLGPNGSGKTTLMKMLTNLIKPTAGEIEIFGQPLTPSSSYDVLGRIGSMIEYPIFYEKFTAKENLELHCEYMGYHNKKAINEVLEMVHLINIENKPVENFSLGMKQRLGIARAIITRPELLILDEPINGLDPIGIREIRNLFKLLCKEYDITMLISSHILAEIEQMADTIGVINKGKLIEEVSMEEMREKNTEYMELVTSNLTRACFILENRLHLRNFKIIDQKIIRIFEQSVSQLEISKTMILNDIEIESMSKKITSLEEYFMGLMDKEKQDQVR
ncbi:ABC transporter ATP-binding protein [Virgibacillus proomii]|uniref:ABC transporter ATP-binding protein n=1 Tax=Virgibacillus proomii TaxID=84407 RepID=UPI001C119C24|nr:ABC transporter ATP-binding protein [Virgibacillus proomii]MBU5267561.1 ABC transporter ATP-binding protein [Virgibacillus proomii]